MSLRKIIAIQGSKKEVSFFKGLAPEDLLLGLKGLEDPSFTQLIKLLESYPGLLDPRKMTVYKDSITVRMVNHFIEEQQCSHVDLEATKKILPFLVQPYECLEESPNATKRMYHEKLERKLNGIAGALAFIKTHKNTPNIMNLFSSPRFVLGLFGMIPNFKYRVCSGDKTLGRLFFADIQKFNRNTKNLVTFKIELDDGFMHLVVNRKPKSLSLSSVGRKLLESIFNLDPVEQEDEPPAVEPFELGLGYCLDLVNVVTYSLKIHVDKLQPVYFLSLRRPLSYFQTQVISTDSEGYYSFINFSDNPIATKLFRRLLALPNIDLDPEVQELKIELSLPLDKCIYSVMAQLVFSDQCSFKKIGDNKNHEVDFIKFMLGTSLFLDFKAFLSLILGMTGALIVSGNQVQSFAGDNRYEEFLTTFYSEKFESFLSGEKFQNYKKASEFLCQINPKQAAAVLNKIESAKFALLLLALTEQVTSDETFRYIFNEMNPEKLSDAFRALIGHGLRGLESATNLVNLHLTTDLFLDTVVESLYNQSEKVTWTFINLLLLKTIPLTFIKNRPKEDPSIIDTLPEIFNDMTPCAVARIISDVSFFPQSSKENIADIEQILEKMGHQSISVRHELSKKAKKATDISSSDSGGGGSAKGRGAPLAP